MSSAREPRLITFMDLSRCCPVLGFTLLLLSFLPVATRGAEFAPATEVRFINMIMSESCSENPQKSCRDSSCHPKESVGRRIIHPVFLEQRCTRCHVKPQSFWAPLLETWPDLACLTCHFDVGWKYPEAELAHPPTTRNCVACHNPHESRIRNRLRNEENLRECSKCHEPFLTEMQSMPYRHQHFELKTECGFCHNAHRRGEGKFVRENASESCLTCHDMPIQYKGGTLENIVERLREAPVVHGVMNEGSCPVCHTPHGSPQPALLNAGYPAGSYEVYSPEQYQLCSQCHQNTLAENYQGEERTKFRHGSANLHRLHVIELGRGRACHLCHEAHASDRPHLMRDRLVFGVWNAPFEYESSDEGGQCLTPCHREKEYRRVIPLSIFPSGPTTSTLSSKKTTTSRSSASKDHPTP